MKCRFIYFLQSIDLIREENDQRLNEYQNKLIETKKLYGLKTLVL